MSFGSRLKLKARLYCPVAIGRIELEALRSIILLAQLGEINLPARHGYSYAVYEKYYGGKIDHKFYPTINRLMPSLKDEDSVEIFFRIPDGCTIRVVFRSPEEFIEIPSGEGLRYEFIHGTDDNLIIYFDYSRLTSKIALTQEYLPRFGFRTKSSVIKLSNTLGYWGTACLFDSNGNPIYHIIADFFNRIVHEYNFKKVYLIGGSQGGTASIVYSKLIGATDITYSVCPVEISKKVMLKQLALKIADSDLDEVCNIFSLGSRSEKVRLFTTIGDYANYPFHSAIAAHKSLGGYQVCTDKSVTHGDCLKYFIKLIYSDLNDRVSD